jgi:SEC-C motif-containing protein
MKTCFCHSKFPYNSCCKKFHQGTLPENALQLMRYRYCAYALDLVNYIIHTTHKNNPSYKQDYPAWKKELKNFYKNTKFENLEILHFEEKERLAFVSFIATLKEGSHDLTFTEKSTFKKEENMWLYLEEITYPGRFLEIT